MIRYFARLQAKSLTAFLGAGMLILAACTSPSPTPTEIRTPGNTLEAIVANLPLDFPIQVYQGKAALGGTSLNLSDIIANGKPVVLNFWAGLCPPCRAEMPDLQLFHDEFKNDVTLIGIDLGQYTALGTQKDAQDLLNELGITYPAGSTEEALVVRRYEVFSMPTTLFITTNGKVFRKWGGLLNREVLADISNEMLAQESS